MAHRSVPKGGGGIQIKGLSGQRREGAKEMLRISGGLKSTWPNAQTIQRKAEISLRKRGYKIYGICDSL